MIDHVILNIFFIYFIFLTHKLQATGLVIGETAIIGINCTFLHGVTLGTNGKDNGDRHPKIGNNVLIGCNAIVLGNITIGNNVKIGSGSVVVKSIQANMTAVGNPVRIINKTVVINHSDGSIHVNNPLNQSNSSINHSNQTLNHSNQTFNQSNHSFNQSNDILNHSQHKITPLTLTATSEVDELSLAIADKIIVTTPKVVVLHQIKKYEKKHTLLSKIKGFLRK